MRSGVSGEPVGWMTRAGAARWSSLSVKSIDRAIRAGEVVSVRKGRKRLVERASLDAWIRSDRWLEDLRAGDDPQEGRSGGRHPGGVSAAARGRKRSTND